MLMESIGIIHELCTLFDYIEYLLYLYAMLVDSRYSA